MTRGRSHRKLMLTFGLIGAAVVAPAMLADDPEVFAWEPAGTLAAPRAYAKVVPLATGEIFIFGGLDADDPRVVNDTTEIYEPRTGVSIVLPQRLPGRTNHSVTVGWGDRVVVAGGSEWRGNGWAVIDRVDVFQPYTRTWLRARPMLDRRTGHGAAALPDGRILVAGGYEGPRLIASAEIYDPRTDRWERAAAMPLPRGDFTMSTLVDGRVLVAGGLEGKDPVPSPRALYYDPRSDRWTDGPRHLADRVLHTSVALPNGDMLIIGGQRSGAATAERYDLRLGRFFHAGTLAEPRMLGVAAALPDGRVLLTGGLAVSPDRKGFTPSAKAELWDQSSGLWGDAPGDRVPRVYGRLIATEFGLYELTGAGAGDRAVQTVERFFVR